MASGPTPQTHFEAWGQAVYKVTTTSKGYEAQEHPNGLFVLFAISDAKRQWLGWYSFNTDYTQDIVQAGSPTHEVIGEKSAFSSHFTMRQPIRVDELCGPELRRAVIAPGHHDLGSDIIDLSIAISRSPGLSKVIEGSHPIHLYIKRKQDLRIQMQFGYVQFIMSERFKYPTPHLNVSKRLRTFEHNLTSGT